MKILNQRKSYLVNIFRKSLLLSIFLSVFLFLLLLLNKPVYALCSSNKFNFHLTDQYPALDEAINISFDVKPGVNYTIFIVNQDDPSQNLYTKNWREDEIPDGPFVWSIQPSEINPPLTTNADYWIQVNAVNGGIKCSGVDLKPLPAGDTTNRPVDALPTSNGNGGGVPGENPCPGGVCNTAIGTFSSDPLQFVGKVLSIAVGLAGGIAFILMVIGAIRVLTSAGNPQSVNAGRDMIVAALAGLLFLIFSVLILQFIGIHIVSLPF